MDQLLKSKTIKAERKDLTFEWRENGRGKYLAIVEQVKGHSDRVLIPESAMSEAMGAISEVCGG